MSEMMPKFRAWDKNTKEMVVIRTIDLERDGTIGCVVDYSDINLDVSECVLMQSTGLKDKNGVEIFEGDILKNRRYSGIRVLFEKGAFKVRYKRSKVCIVTQDLSSLLEKYESTIIIGNIYENLELLEVGE